MGIDRLLTKCSIAMVTTISKVSAHRSESYCFDATISLRGRLGLANAECPVANSSCNLVERHRTLQPILIRRQLDHRAHLKISTERIGKLYLSWRPAFRFEHQG